MSLTMEGVSSSGVTVVGSDAPSDYHVSPRTGNPPPAGGSAAETAVPAAQGGVLTPQPAATTMPAKKKRGRPRKYAPDGSVTMALSPKPISSSAPAPPPVIDFSAGKRGKVVRPASSVSSKAKFEVENIGEWVACPVGAGGNFTPHILTVNSGELGPRAICILSANGVLSSVTLRQRDSSGGTLTYEGRFEILSLSGSFMPNEIGGTRSRSGGMSISLASPDGRVVGGGVAGLLIAATPVQVVVGSFLSADKHEQKQKLQKNEVISTVTPTAAVPVSAADPITNFASSTSFRGENWSAVPAVADTRNNPTDINVSLPRGG